MRVERLDFYHLKMPLRRPFKTSFGEESVRHCILIRLRGEGLEGWGECVAGAYPGYSYETVGTAWHVLSEFFGPAILGRSLERPEQLREVLAGYRGHPLARAGLEMALWDALGHAQGKSLAEMLGGVRARVPVGVSVGLQRSVEELVEQVSAYVEAGYQRVKIKIQPGEDLDLVKAVRLRFPDLPLQVDANSAYSLRDAAIFQAMDAFNLLLIEQPLAEDDLVDHSRLQVQVKTPLCLDESILSLRHARQALEIGACRIINIKQARVGGLLEAKRIHDLCLEREVPVWCGGMLETGIGRAANLALASLPGFTLPGDISATARYYELDIAEPPFVLNRDSTIQVPRGPGLGVQVRYAALERFLVRAETLRRP